VRKANLLCVALVAGLGLAAIVFPLAAHADPLGEVCEVDTGIPFVFVPMPSWCLDDGTAGGPAAYAEDPPAFDPGPGYVEKMTSLINCSSDGEFRAVSDGSNTQFVGAAYLVCTGGFSETSLLVKIQENTGAGWSDRNSGSASDPRSAKNPKSAAVLNTCGRTSVASYRLKVRAKAWDADGLLVWDKPYQVDHMRGRCR